ncbi:hypothetical protein [uncultured Helicobacter sp.]|uniref:hypothetical protein n=1 Tax=uncultured Helicobacter sp. TaxID=175537 RepID=UPI0025E332BA|nr:hypothetical protein [uncultured Helicobacter sp.]
MRALLCCGGDTLKCDRLWGIVMGFEFFGLKVWDLSEPFGYFEAFSGIVVVLTCAFVGFLILRHFRPKKF